MKNMSANPLAIVALNMMRVQTIKAFLLFIVFNFTIYSFCFAQVDLANQIIEKRIDELWTTVKLNIGYANIASKHWLPGLYERNNFQLLWQNPQNVTDLLTAAGSIAEDGLDPEDYRLSDLLVLKLSLDGSKSPDPTKLADYDILLTDSLVRLCYHIQFGKVDPESLDPAWNMTRQIRNKNPVAAIEKRLRTGSLAEGLKKIRPKIDYYRRLKSADIAGFRVYSFISLKRSKLIFSVILNPSNMHHRDCMGY